MTGARSHGSRSGAPRTLSFTATSSRRRVCLRCGQRETLRNYGNEATFCLVELELDGDFAPIFDARDQRVDPARVEAVRVTAEHGRMAFRWQRGGHSRAVWADFSEPPRFDGRIASWEVIVPARQSWSVCLQVTPVMDGGVTSEPAR